MKKLILVSCLLFAGCAALDPVGTAVNNLREWNAVAKAQAESGAIKREDYAKEKFRRIQELPPLTPGKYDLLAGVNEEITYSAALDKGKITKEEFDMLMRTVSIETDRKVAAAINQQQQMQAIKQMSDAATLQAVTPLLKPPQPQFPTRLQTNCTSRAVGNTVSTNCY